MRYVPCAAALVLGLLLGSARAVDPDPRKDLDDIKPNPKKDLDDVKPNPKKDLDTDTPPSPKKTSDTKPSPKKDLDKIAPPGPPLPGGHPGKKTGKKDLDKSANTEKMIKAGQLTGTLVAVVETKKSLRLKVPYAVPKLNEGELNNMARAQQDLVNAAYNRDPRERLRGIQDAQVRLLQAQARLYKLEEKSQEVELSTTEDVKVRTARPPDQFDDKGRVKKLTVKELKELRGDDPRLPGYTAEFSDLRQGQVVAVTLVRKKNAPPPAARPRKSRDADVDLLADHLPMVSTIVILREPDSD